MTLRDARPSSIVTSQLVCNPVLVHVQQHDEESSTVEVTNTEFLFNALNLCPVGSFKHIESQTSCKVVEGFVVSLSHPVRTRHVSLVMKTTAPLLDSMKLHVLGSDTSNTLMVSVYDQTERSDIRSPVVSCGLNTDPSPELSSAC